MRNDIWEINEKGIDEVFELYIRTKASVPHGFLADRSYDDFRRIIASDSKGVNLGVYRNGRLVAYLLTEWIKGNPYPECDFLDERIHADKSILAARGLVVAPEARGAFLSADLVREREKSVRNIGADFLVGLVDIGNIQSLRAQLAGDITFIVGMAYDETSLNFVICVSPNIIPDCEAQTFEHDVKDIDGLGSLIANGYIGYRFLREPCRLGFCRPLMTALEQNLK